MVKQTAVTSMKGVLVCLATLLLPAVFAQNQKPTEVKTSLSRLPAVQLDGEVSGTLRTLFLWEIGQPKIRRTEVRPMFRRQAISDLLTPARCSCRISTAWMAAVAGLPSR